MTCDNSTTKPCSTCGEVKALSEFSINKNMAADRLNKCLVCFNLQDSIYRKTKHGLIANIYSGQRRNSRKRDHKPPPYSLYDLRVWMLNQPVFHGLYDKWIESGYDKWLKPSCDRTDDYRGYSLDRLQLMTWKDNADKADRDTMNGILRRSTKPVVQMDFNGTFIEEFYSMSQAARETGCNMKNISQCCLGKRKTHSGYKWAYSNPIHNNEVR